MCVVLGEQWIKCRARDGMFRDEVVVEIGGGYFFVNSTSVRNWDRMKGIAELRVRIFEWEDRDWIETPTPYKEVVLLTDHRPPSDRDGDGASDS